MAPLKESVRDMDPWGYRARFTGLCSFVGDMIRCSSRRRGRGCGRGGGGALVLFVVVDVVVVIIGRRRGRRTHSNSKTQQHYKYLA